MSFLQTGLSPAEAARSASRYLKLANEAVPGSAHEIEYRLMAADLFIQAKESNQARYILKETPITNPILDPSIRKNVLKARFALLKNDLSTTRLALKKALLTLNQYTHSNLALGPPSERMTGVQRIALLIPSKGPHAEAAKNIRDGFLAAYYQKNHNSGDSSVKIYDTSETNVRDAYHKALSEQANFIVGPLTKPEVQTMARINLVIPVLALNTIGESSFLPKKLYQFGLMPEDEVVAVAEYANRRGHRDALILAPDTEWGHRLVSTFRNIWEYQGGRVLDHRYFKSNHDLDEKIRALLRVTQDGRREDADMIFLAASGDLARQIKPLLNLHFAENLPVYATATVYSGTPHPGKDQDLNGIYFCDMPWIIENKGHTQQSPRLYALGMDAYQLATILGSSNDLPSRGVSGYTGDLQLNRYQRIKRGLVCAKFEHGVPRQD